MQIRTLENSEHYKWGRDCDGWYFLNREDISIILERMPPGTSERLHYHEKARQFFYILKGTATFLIKTKEFSVGANMGIEISPDDPHQIRNDGNEVLEFLLYSTAQTKKDRIDLEAHAD